MGPVGHTIRLVTEPITTLMDYRDEEGVHDAWPRGVPNVRLQVLKSITVSVGILAISIPKEKVMCIMWNSRNLQVRL